MIYRKEKNYLLAKKILFCSKNLGDGHEKKSSSDRLSISTDALWFKTA